MSELTNAVVVVTGGARGVGLALAREAVRRGAKVTIADIEDPKAAVDELREMGGEVEGIVADVENVEDVQRLATEVIDRFGEVNLICNNAAFAVAGMVQDTTPEDARRTMTANIAAPFTMIHTFAPHLRDAAAAGRPAHVLNVGSEHSLGVPPYVAPFSAYTTSKFGILGLTLVAQRDLESWGINVALLAPGWVLTENVRAFCESDEEVAKAILPYAQESSVVAEKAFDGLLRGTRVIATNPHSRAFAMEHLRSMMIDVQELPVVDAPGEHAHDGTGDASQCPFLGGR